jgi:hypothetical protein
VTDAFEDASFVAVEAVWGGLEAVEVARGFFAGGEIKDARLAARDVAVSDGGLEVLVEVEAGFFSVVVEGLAIDLTAVEVVGFAAGAAFVVGAVVVLVEPNVPELRI